MPIPFMKAVYPLAERKRFQTGNSRPFFSYLKFLEQSGRPSVEIDLDSFNEDITKGMIFDSTIPRGFGVGSSGALTAAVYDRYVEKGSKETNILKLKEIFSVFESHFHGTGSGLDPLVSYLGKSIFINGFGDLSVVDIPKSTKGQGSIFLLNTGKSKVTGPLVDLFLEKYQSQNFARRCNEELLPVTNKCIDSFLSGDKETLVANFEKLSRFQYHHFTPMIPPLFRDVWGRGLMGQDYYLKLCGSGGGGFFLGLTMDLKKTTSLLGSYEIRPVIRF